MNKGQGMFEYILLLAGVLLVVVLAIALLRGGLFQSASSNVDKNAFLSELVTESSCFNSDGSWNSGGDHLYSGTKCPLALGAQNYCGTGANYTCYCGTDPRT